MSTGVSLNVQFGSPYSFASCISILVSQTIYVPLNGGLQVTSCEGVELAVNAQVSCILGGIPAAPADPALLPRTLA